MSKYSEKRRFGNAGEDIACEFLRRKGFEILDRNYLRPWGEIDIVALADDTVRFIEVKSVSREIKAGVTREMDYRPEEMVHVKKLKKLARTAALYMDNSGDNRSYQIDVVGVIIDTRTRKARCRLFEQVLDGGEV
jgi:putative endonuclease